MRWIPAALLAAVLLFEGPPAGAQSGPPPEVQKAEALLRDRRADEAWRLLAPLQAQYAGQPEFDLTLATAAIDSGRANLATFALERVVLQQPGNATARLELVRAYYELRDYERAERELQFLLKGEPPPEVRALAARYRDAMRQARPAAAAARGWTAYVEAGLGHDSNANVASAEGSFFVPSLGAELIVDPALVRDGDAFRELAAGVEYGIPLSSDFAAILGADLRLRSYAELDAFDTREGDVRAALHQRLGVRDGLEYTLRHNDYELDHAGYRRMQSGTVQWRRTFGDFARIALGAQGFRLRYRDDEMKASDSDLAALSAGAAYVLDRAARRVALVSVYLGSDNAVRGRADGDRRIYGASAGLQQGFGERLEGYANAVLLHSRYEALNPDFGLQRRDRQLELSLGASWQLGEGWSLRPQLTRTRNASNVPVHDYGRTEAWVSLRRDWQ